MSTSLFDSLCGVIFFFQNFDPWFMTKESGFTDSSKHHPEFFFYNKLNENVNAYKVVIHKTISLD